jgi:hypothetical protein
MIVYSKSEGQNNSKIGKLETPIKMIIEHESDLLSKAGGIAKSLFNIEKSSRFGETIIGGNEFDVFAATEEGGAAEADTLVESYHKFIEHIQFMKEFIISAEMMEDANYGVAADAKRRAENFTRAYYKTINRICEAALANATAKSAVFARAELDLTAPDGIELFSSAHKLGVNGATQSNYYWGDILSSGDANNRVASTALFEQALYELSIKMRNMKDENGECLGYNADTLILPGNRPALEAIARKVCGSKGTTGSDYNDINLHYGAWDIVILPNWQPTDNRIMIMSKEANKNLSGNMLFNRIPLTVTSWVDNHTGNYIWNGRCRFGVGFGSYKHIMLAVDSASSVSGATKL